MMIELGKPKHLAEILALQKVAFYDQGKLYDDYTIRPLLTTLEEISASYDDYLYLIIKEKGQILGSARARIAGKTCHIENVIVHPAHQGEGLGTLLMQALEHEFPDMERFELFTGKKSFKALKFYEKLGYRTFKELPAAGHEPDLVYMEKLQSQDQPQSEEA